MADDPKDQKVDPKKTDQDGQPGDSGVDRDADKKDAAPVPDPEKIRAEARESILSEISGRLKKLFGVESIDALEEQHLKRKGEFEELFQKERERAEKWKERFKNTLFRERVLSAASKAGAIDPELIHGLVKERGAQVSDEGEVAVDGRPVDQIIAEILEARPYLKKASGKEGGGAPAGDDKAAETEKDRLAAQLEEAKKKGDVIAILGLKRQIAKLS